MKQFSTEILKNHDIYSCGHCVAYEISYEYLIGLYRRQNAKLDRF